MYGAYFFLHALALSLFSYAFWKLRRDALLIFFMVFALFFANFFFQKQTLFFGMPATMGPAYIISITILQLLYTEYKGATASYRLLGLFFLFTIFLVFAVHLHLLYRPGPTDEIEWALRETFSNATELFTASVLTLFSLLALGITAWQYLRRFGLSPFWACTLLTISTQLIDTFIFIPTATGTFWLVSGVLAVKALCFVMSIPVCFWIIRDINREDHLELESL